MTEKIKGTGEGGKGDTYRKITDKEKWDLNFDRIWGTAEEKEIAIKKLKEMGEV